MTKYEFDNYHGDDWDLPGLWLQTKLNERQPSSYTILQYEENYIEVMFEFEEETT